MDHLHFIYLHDLVLKQIMIIEYFRLNIFTGMDLNITVALQ